MTKRETCALLVAVAAASYGLLQMGMPWLLAGIVAGFAGYLASQYL